MAGGRRLAGLVMIAAAVLGGCCHTCREGQPKPAPAAGLVEVPAPYRLAYDAVPTRYIRDFVVIQGGREFVLQPEIPGEVSK